MKIVVIGGTGLIGAKLVANLRQKGHEVVAASPSSGVNAVTGEGLEAALAGAGIVVDVSNAPSFEDQAVMDFFRASSGNLLAAEAAAGVTHHVALSVVGTDRLQDSGYFRAKLVQERLIETSPIPYTIVRATQFFEFLDAIALGGTVGDTTHQPPAPFQPIAADDVAAAVAQAALDAPANGIVEIAGPERVGMAALLDRYLKARGDGRTVVTDDQARYFGLAIDEISLNPGPKAHIAPTRFDDWVARTTGH